jgi:Complex I intermediate-associated protein 30 (CIA30)
MNLPASPSMQLIDDRSSGDARSALGTSWRLVTDNVMGGVSRGGMQFATAGGRPCLRLTGTVSLENNGGFVQASLDLDKSGLLDARGYAGIEIEVFGNGESYNLHLRSADTRIVWQSYRASFQAPPRWQTLRLPFASFQPYRIDKPLDLSKLRRLGVVAIGREMRADICIARLTLYP